MRYLAFAFLLACGAKPGQPCGEDKDCGRGFDCYQKACTRVCTSTDECGSGEQCVRYRCMSTSAPAPMRPIAAPAARTDNQPPPPLPAPDTTAAELRALRREVEAVRRDQARILELLEKKP